MNLVAELKDEILRMAAGNLRDSVPNMGQDEIGIIAEELDKFKSSIAGYISSRKRKPQSESGSDYGDVT